MLSTSGFEVVSSYGLGLLGLVNTDLETSKLET